MNTTINTKQTKCSKRKPLLINIITLFRIPLSIIFCALVYIDNNQIVLFCILFGFIAITDFFDGKLARKYNVQTRDGAILDVMCDFFFIITSSLILCFQGLFPSWLLIGIIVKFAEFWITSIFRKDSKRNHLFKFDIIGRFVAIVFYLLPLLTLILNVTVSNNVFKAVTTTIYIVTIILAFISVLQRVKT